MKRSKVIYTVYVSLLAAVYLLAAAGYMLAGEAWYDAGYDSDVSCRFFAG